MDENPYKSPEPASGDRVRFTISGILWGTLTVALLLCYAALEFGGLVYGWFRHGELEHLKEPVVVIGIVVGSMAGIAAGAWMASKG